MISKNLAKLLFKCLFEPKIKYHTKNLFLENTDYFCSP